MAENCVANPHGVVESFSRFFGVAAEGLQGFKRFRQAFLFAWRGGAYKVRLTFSDDPLTGSGIETRVKGDTTLNASWYQQTARRFIVDSLAGRGVFPVEPGTPGAFTVVMGKPKNPYA